MQKNNLVIQPPVSNKSLDERQLSRAIRLGIASEEELIQYFESVAENSLVKTVFQDIANSEREQIGKLHLLLNLLLPDESKIMDIGAEEVNRIALACK